MRFSIDRHLGKKVCSRRCMPQTVCSTFCEHSNRSSAGGIVHTLAAFADEGEPAEAEGDRNLSTQVTATASTAAEGGGSVYAQGDVASSGWHAQMGGWPWGLMSEGGLRLRKLIQPTLGQLSFGFGPRSCFDDVLWLSCLVW